MTPMEALAVWRAWSAAPVTPRALIGPASVPYLPLSG
jgi:hypothetical protein